MKKGFKLLCVGLLSFVMLSVSGVVFKFNAALPNNNYPCCNAISAASGPVINWGLTPNTKEQTPGAPAGGAKLLAENNGMFVSNADAEAGNKKVYLTFDLGYEAGYTHQVLDILKEKNIKAIFFLCGNYLQEDELITRMINEGHIIGNHTNHHKDLPSLSYEKMKEDIVSLADKFNDKYSEIYKKPLTYFRPPQGRLSDTVLKEVNAQGMKTVMWSIAIVDWGKTPINAATSANKIASRIHPGAIILSHITNSGTPEMLKLLFPKLAEKGYEIGNAGDL